MDRAALIYLNKRLTGELTESDGIFTFQYKREYLAQSDAKAISLTLPLQEEAYVSSNLFPFFCGLIAEGVNRDLQCRLLKVDEQDHFGLLLKTGDKDTIGAVTVKPKTQKT